MTASLVKDPKVNVWTVYIDGLKVGAICLWDSKYWAVYFELPPTSRSFGMLDEALDEIILLHKVQSS